MASNNSLRYGFDWDRAYFINLFMQYQLLMPIVTALTIYPIMLYLLMFENKSMRKDLRIFYGLTLIAKVVHEWSFCFAFRMYPVLPIAALYCEGPLCFSGLNKQILLSILAIPVILLVSAFFPLSFRMHSMVQTRDSKWRFSPRDQIIINLLINIILLANVVGFGFFGRDHDDSARLLQDPELVWLSERGGIIFLFGPPGDAQYFRWGKDTFPGCINFVYCTSSRILDRGLYGKYCKVPQGLKMISGSTQSKSIRLYYMFMVQGMGSFMCYILPLTCMFVAMVIDVPFLPGWMTAFLRISLILLFTMVGHQFCVYFILKNPLYRKIVIQKFKKIFLCNARMEAAPMSHSLNNCEIARY